MVISPDGDDIYDINDPMLSKLIKMNPRQAGKYVRKHGKRTSVYSVADIEADFDENADSVEDICWQCFVDDVKNYLGMSEE